MALGGSLAASGLVPPREEQARKDLSGLGPRPLARAGAGAPAGRFASAASARPPARARLVRKGISPHQGVTDDTARRSPLSKVPPGPTSASMAVLPCLRPLGGPAGATSASMAVRGANSALLHSSTSASMSANRALRKFCATVERNVIIMALRKVNISELPSISTEGMKLGSYVACGKQIVFAFSLVTSEEGMRGKIAYLYSRFVGWHVQAPEPEMKPEGRVVAAFAWAANSVNAKVYNYTSVHEDGTPTWAWGGHFGMALLDALWQDRKALGMRYVVPLAQRSSVTENAPAPAANDVESMVAAFRASKSLPTPVVSAPAEEAPAPEEPAPEEVSA